jgi:hypothetical protein
MQKSGLSRDTDLTRRFGSLTEESFSCLQSIHPGYEEIMHTPLAIQQLIKISIITSSMEVDHV